jgi:hypothetical protein
MMISPKIRFIKIVPDILAQIVYGFKSAFDGDAICGNKKAPFLKWSGADNSGAD